MAQVRAQVGRVRAQVFCRGSKHAYRRWCWELGSFRGSSDGVGPVQTTKAGQGRQAVCPARNLISSCARVSPAREASLRVVAGLLLACLPACQCARSLARPPEFVAHAPLTGALSSPPSPRAFSRPVGRGPACRLPIIVSTPPPTVSTLPVACLERPQELVSIHRDCTASPQPMRHRAGHRDTYRQR